MKKRVPRGLCRRFFSSCSILFILESVSAAPAAVSRPEHRDRVSEEAQYHTLVIIPLTHRRRISPC